MRTCPTCFRSMNPYDHEGVTLDVCSGCRGLWLDTGELTRVAGAVELMEPGAPVGRDATRGPCPACGQGLVERAVAGGGSLRVDACPRCAGVFLDPGELQRVRQLVGRRLRHVHARDARLLAEVKTASRKRRQALRAKPRVLEVEAAHASRGNFLSLLLAIPVEEDPLIRSRPILAAPALIAGLALIWLWQLAAGVEQTVWRWGLVPETVQAGAGLITLLTSNFLHGGWLHVVFNLYFLWIFGDNVEHRVGSAPFIAYFVLWGLIGSAFSVLLTGPEAAALPHVGASGAIAGAMGAYMILFPGHRFVIPFFGVWFLGAVLKIPAWAFVGFWGAMQLASGWLELPAVAWWDHLGGLLAGIAVGLLYRSGKDRDARGPVLGR